MRTNLPVTTIEYPITDETLIVSRTDTKGRLTYFNDEFVQAAGFTPAELMGQPHADDAGPDRVPHGLAFGQVERVREGREDFGEGDTLDGGHLQKRSERGIVSHHLSEFCALLRPSDR